MSNIVEIPASAQPGESMWQGELRPAKMESVVSGLLIPNQAFSKRLASELLQAWKRLQTLDENGPIRLFIALRILRAWNNGTAGYDGIVVKTINDWIDGGMIGPVPYPDRDHFFEEWAQENGFSRVGNAIGVSFEMRLTRIPEALHDR